MNFQEKLAETPGVQAVIGPGQATDRVAPLQALGNSVLSSEGNIGPVKQLGRLGRSLDVAAGGVGQLRDGISEASNGAGLLATGSGRAGDGAQLIANGLTRALGGSQEAINALDRFAKGSKQLEKGIGLAVVGAFQIKLNTRDTILPNLRQNPCGSRAGCRRRSTNRANQKLPELIAPAHVIESELKQALAQLNEMTVGKSDPKYEAALERGAQGDGGGDRDRPGDRRAVRPAARDPRGRALRRPAAGTGSAGPEADRELRRREEDDLLADLDQELPEAVAERRRKARRGAARTARRQQPPRRRLRPAGPRSAAARRRDHAAERRCGEAGRRPRRPRRRRRSAAGRPSPPASARASRWKAGWNERACR